MSIFDPQQVYYNRRYYNAKGQVNQKKIPGLNPQLTLPTNPADIPQSISILNAYGYTVLPPGDHPYENQNLSGSVNDVYYLAETPLESDTGNVESDLHFSVLWNQAKDYFTQLLSNDIANINVFRFRFSVYSASVSFAIKNNESSPKSITTGIYINSDFSGFNSGWQANQTKTARNFIFSVNEDYFYDGTYLINNSNDTVLLCDHVSNDKNDFNMLKTNTLDFVFGKVIIQPNSTMDYEYQFKDLMIPFSISIEINVK